MAKESVEEILRRKPAEPEKVKAEEKDAKHISIDCIDEKPGSGYYVIVDPKPKNEGPGTTHKNQPVTFKEPYKHIFGGKEAKAETLAFLESIL